MARFLNLATYLNDRVRSLVSSNGKDVLISVHEDRVSFHILAVHLESIGRVDDCGLLNE